MWLTNWCPLYSYLPFSPLLLPKERAPTPYSAYSHSSSATRYLNWLACSACQFSGPLFHDRLPYLAWTYLVLGDDERAEEVVLEGVERARAQGHRLALVELLRVRGMMLSRQHRWDEAEGAFEEAVSMARSVRYPYAEARALYEWGSMYIGRLDTKQGWGRLEEAVEIFRRLGSRPYSDLTQKAITGSGLG